MSENIGRYNVIFEILTKQSGDIQKIKKEATGLQGVFNRAKGAFLGIVAAQAVNTAIGGLRRIGSATLGLAGQAEQVQTSFETMLGSASEAQKLIDELNSFSLKTPFTPQELQSSARTLLGFGRDAQQVTEDLEILGNAAASTGANIGSVALVYGQVAGIGKLQGQDALQFINQGIPIYNILADTIGKSVSEIKKMQEEGKITFDLIQESFKKASEEGGKFYGGLAKQSKTFFGLMSTLRGAVQEAGKQLGNAFLPLIKLVLPPLIEGVFKVVNALQEFAKPAEDVARWIATIGKNFYDTLKEAMEPFTSIINKAGGYVRSFFQYLTEGVSRSDTVREFLNFLVRTGRTLSNIFSSVAGVVGTFFSNLITKEDMEINRQFIRQFIGWVQEIPAVINGVLEGVRFMFSDFSLRFTHLWDELRAGYYGFMKLTGRITPEGRAELVLLTRRIEEYEKLIREGGNLREAYRRGYDEIKNLEVEVPEFNVEDTKDSGKDVVKNFVEGVDEEIEESKKDKKKRTRGLLEIAGLPDLDSEVDKIKAFSDDMRVLYNELAALGEIGLITPETEEQFESIAKFFSDINGSLEDIEEKRKNGTIEEINKIIADQLEALKAAAEKDKDKDKDTGRPFLQDFLGLSDEDYEKVKTAVDRATSYSKQAIDELYRYEEEKINARIKLQEKRVEKAQELAEQGKTKQLEIEEARLQELTEQRDRYAQQQRAIDEAQILSSNAVAAAASIEAIAKSFRDGGVVGIATGIATSIALASQVALIATTINRAFADLPAYKDGVEAYMIESGLVQGVGTGRSDSNLVRLSKGERVVDQEKNAEIGYNFPNSELVNAVKLYKQFPYLKVAPGENSAKTIDRQELREIRKSIESIKIHTNFDQKGFDQYIERRVDRVIRRKKLKS